MTDQNDDAPQPGSDRNEMRAMWIATAAIVVLIVGAMGAKMLFGTSTNLSDTGEMSSQSRTTAPQ